MRGLAAELGLAPAEVPWHAARDGVAELGGWLALVTGSLGKIGQDLILLGQSEVGEVTAGTGGGSSTMPHKANPVGAEALVTLARLNAGTLGQLHQAMLHAGRSATARRSGSSGSRCPRSARRPGRRRGSPRTSPAASRRTRSGSPRPSRPTAG